MDLKIEGKVALVAAATPAVGFVLARALAAEGVRVVLTSHVETGLHETVEAIRKEGGRGFGIAADLNRLEALELLLDRMARVTGHPDILVLENAYTGRQVGPAGPRADGFGGQGLSFPAAVRLIRAVLPAMLERGWGRLLHVTSVPHTLPAGQPTLAQDPHTAMTDFVGDLADDLGDEDVTVNTLALGDHSSQAPGAAGDGTDEGAENGAALFLVSEWAAGLTRLRRP